jgi:3'-phosphoadenosine 5'-phosphosulfate sulfotransferase (PAPS reductase)/FAD synthetase
MNTKTIIVPVSGGKDSQVVLSMALKTGSQVVCVHQNTGFDHHETYKQIEAMERFYGVKVQHTKSKYGGMINFINESGYFPSSAGRGCTKELKQRPFLAWLQENDFNHTNCEIWFGMRAEESRERKDKYGEVGVKSDDEFTLSDVSMFYGSNKALRETVGGILVRLPIVSWTTEQVFGYLENEGAPINHLYKKGHSRVGCYPCLLARKSEWQLVASDPTGRNHIQMLVDIEDKWANGGNPRKMIRVHKVWDVRDFLNGSDVRDLFAEECGWCSI